MEIGQMTKSIEQINAEILYKRYLKQSYKNNRKLYDPDFKEAVLKELRAIKSVSKISFKYKVPKSTLRQWVREA